MGRARGEEVNSPNVKLLYDIYHMQIMEGDLIETIRKNIKWIGHFHTGGVPGRHELDGTQEVQWDGVMRAIADAGFKGYVAHEFVPTGDPLEVAAEGGGFVRCVGAGFWRRAGAARKSFFADSGKSATSRRNSNERHPLSTISPRGNRRL